MLRKEVRVLFTQQQGLTPVFVIINIMWLILVTRLSYGG